MIKTEKKTSHPQDSVITALPMRDIPLEVHSFKRSFNPHGHTYFEAIFVTQSGGRHIIDGKTHVMKKGEVYLLGPLHIHSAESYHGKNPAHINVSFFPETLRLEKGDSLEIIYKLFYNLGEIQPVSLPRADFSSCLSILAAMRRIHVSRSHFRDESLSSLLKSLMLIVVNAAELSERPYDSRIIKILQYLNTHFQENLESRNLAGIVQLSPSRFAQIFKKAMGRTVKEVLLQLRLNFAKKLLLTTTMPVVQVMRESGFNNYNYFHRAFRHFAGKPLSFYRAKSRS